MANYQELLEATYSLAGQGKLDEFATYLADDVSWTESEGFPYAGTYIGSDAVIKNVHQRLGSEWLGYKAEPEIYTFNDNMVMVYGFYSGTFKGSGKSFRTPFVHFYTFDQNDKVAQFKQIVDSVPVQQAMHK